MKAWRDGRFRNPGSLKSFVLGAVTGRISHSCGRFQLLSLSPLPVLQFSSFDPIVTTGCISVGESNFVYEKSGLIIAAPMPVEPGVRWGSETSGLSDRLRSDLISAREKPKLRLCLIKDSLFTSHSA